MCAVGVERVKKSPELGRILVNKTVWGRVYTDINIKMFNSDPVTAMIQKNELWEVHQLLHQFQIPKGR